MRKWIPTSIACGFGVLLAACGDNSCHDSRIDLDFSTIGADLKNYHLQNGCYPSTEQGLAALVTRPDTKPLPKRWTRTADAVRTDAWNHPYHYRLLSQDGEPAFEIISAGKDGILGTKDDLSSLNETR